MEVLRVFTLVKSSALAGFPQSQRNVCAQSHRNVIGRSTQRDGPPGLFASLEVELENNADAVLALVTVALVG